MRKMIRFFQRLLSVMGLAQSCRWRLSKALSSSAHQQQLP